jgi:hypothetical protein
MPLCDKLLFILFYKGCDINNTRDTQLYQTCAWIVQYNYLSLFGDVVQLRPISIPLRPSVCIDQIKHRLDSLSLILPVEITDIDITESEKKDGIN